MRKHQVFIIVLGGNDISHQARTSLSFNIKGAHKDIERAITSRLTYKIFVMDAVRALKCYTQDANAGCGERGSTSRVNNIRKVLQ